MMAFDDGSLDLAAVILYGPVMNQLLWEDTAIEVLVGGAARDAAVSQLAEGLLGQVPNAIQTFLDIMDDAESERRKQSDEP